MARTNQSDDGDRARSNHLALFQFLLLAAHVVAPLAAEEASPAPPKFVLQWGKKGEGDGDFKSPIGVAIDARDVIYVTEFHNHRVQKFDVEGKFLGKFSVPEHPGGIALHPDGRIYVAPMLLHKIAVFTPAGEPSFEFGEKGDGDGQFNQPGGMAFGPDGLLYIADQSNHRVQVFTADGKFVRKFGSYGTEPGQFGGLGPKASRLSGPHFLAFDKQGDLWATEGAQGRIQKLTVEGKPLVAWGKNDEEPGGFGGREKANRNALPGPIGVALDARGRLWVSASNSRLQLFTPEGKYLTGLLVEGDEPGQFLLPHALAFDSRGFLYVVDSSNQRVQKLRP